MTIQTNGINFQDPLRSTPIDDNFNIQTSAINDLQSQIDNITTPASGSEVSNARDYHSALRDRIRSGDKASTNTIITGFEVTESGTPDMNINISDGEAIVAGVGLDRTSISPIAITAPTLAQQLQVVVLNSDNTISVLEGTEHATDWNMPNVSSDQKAIALLILTSGTTSINDGTELFDARDQGCFYRKDGRLQQTFTIQEAINDLPNGGNIDVSNGIYYETLTYDDNQTLLFESNAVLKNTSGTTINFNEIDLSAKSNSLIKWNDGVNRSGYDANNVYDLVTPIGGIISIHPNVKTAYLPTSNNFVLCDTAHAYGGGSATALSSTYFDNTGADLEGYVPDLSDSRFLMGSTAYGLTGSNTIDIAHAHTAGTLYAQMEPTSSSIYFNYSTSSWTAANRVDGITTLATGLSSARTSGVYIGGSTAEELSSTQDIKPQRFYVLYYMRTS